MKRSTRLAALLMILGVASGANAENGGASFSSGPWLDSHSGTRGNGFLLALDSSGSQSPAKLGKGASEEDLPWYSQNRMHKYLGLGSMGLALATLAAPKERGGAHENLAKGAAFLGGAAVANGIYAHWDDMEFTWDDPDTRHAIFGALGALGYLLAVAKDGEGGHAALGGLGAVSMAYAIKITW